MNDKRHKIKIFCLISLVLILIFSIFRFQNVITTMIYENYSVLNLYVGKFWAKAIIIYICSFLCILVCGIVGRHKDKRLMNVGSPFSERHPRLNIIIGLALVIIIGTTFFLAIHYMFLYIGRGISELVDWVSDMASKMEAVVIVAFITGMVSIIGVIISSIVAKIIDYRKSRQDYLARKREVPYGEFVEMIYKIQQNIKNPESYTEEKMLEDLSKFSKQITLWGSSKVVNKWVQFRENGAKPNAGTDNLLLMEEIMNEMRKDLGLKKVKKGNLLAFFVNDIKKVLNSKK
ncbi:MAG: hypothetical protein Q4C61_14925 [Lachnospiraceae bacterium]|nr:hypothetical protein [Lachnospiraceae bacterium]